jgi:hypothetical protein
VGHALLAGDAADEDDRGQVRVDPVDLEHVGAVVRLVLVGVDAVVDHLDPGRVDGRVDRDDVGGHPGRHGDHPVGALDPGLLAEAGDVVAAAQLLHLPGAHRLQAVDADHVRDAVQELGQVPGQVGVPGVAVDQLGVLDPGGDRQVGGDGAQRPQVAASALQGVPGRVGDHLGRSRRAGRPRLPEAVHLEVDQFGQLPRQVFHVDTGTAIHIWGILATEQGHAHGTLLPIQREQDASVIDTRGGVAQT